MKKPLNFSDLTIPAPCHMDWDKMSPAEKGRLCASCKHTVIDFTDGDVGKLNAAMAANSEAFCGRFRSSDLSHAPTFELLPKQRMTRLRRYFVAALTFLGIHTGFHSASAQGDLPTPDKFAGTVEFDSLTEANALEFRFYGNIQESDSLPVERAFVLLEAGGITLAHGYSDEKGNFTLKIPKDKQTEDTLTLFVSHVGRHFAAKGLEWRSQNVFVELKSFALKDNMVIVSANPEVGTVTTGIYISRTHIHCRSAIPIWNLSDNPFLPRRGFDLEDEIFMNRSDVHKRDY